MKDTAVAQVIDFMPISRQTDAQHCPQPMLTGIVRQVRVVRGKVKFRVTCFPAFDYARIPHRAEVVVNSGIPNDKKLHLYRDKTGFDQNFLFGALTCIAGMSQILFSSDTLQLILTSLLFSDYEAPPFDAKFCWRLQHSSETLGPAAITEVTLSEGQYLDLVLSDATPAKSYFSCQPSISLRPFTGASSVVPPTPGVWCAAADIAISPLSVENLRRETAAYWSTWLKQCQYKGRWREHVHRSALTLKGN